MAGACHRRRHAPLAGTSLEVVVATKQHSPFPLGSQDAASVSSQAVLNAMALQLIRWDGS